MNPKRVLENYRCLLKISDRGADIFASGLCASLGCSGTAALKMQLEQERFFRLLDSGGTLASLRERLGPYTATERRGILLHMLEELSGVWTGQTRLRMVRRPLPELESCTAAAVEQAARQFCTEVTVPPMAGLAGRSAPAAALAAAVLAEMPETMPEQIAAASAAAVSAGRRNPLLRLLSALLFLLLTPESGQTEAVAVRLLPPLSLFLQERAWLTGCSVSVPAALTAPVVAVDTGTVPEEPERTGEDGDWEEEPEVPRERERW